MDYTTGKLLPQDINRELYNLSEQSTTTFQWIPAHGRIAGNKKDAALSKAGSKVQFSHSVTYREGKTVIYERYQYQ